MANRSYFLPDEVSTVVASYNKTSLKCLHLNTRSLCNKETEVDAFISSFSFLFDVVMLTETWCKDGQNNYTFSSYQSFSLNRATRRGGGVMLLIKPGVNCELLDSFCVVCNDFEILSARVNKHVFSVCYRPPDGNAPNFFNFYEQFLDFISNNGYYVISGGDFNIDMLANTNLQKAMETLIISNGCENTITLPTRVTKDCETLLDLFITNIDKTNITTAVVSSDLSDHLPIILMVQKHNMEARKIRQRVVCQPITKAGLDSFRNELLQSDFEWLLEIENADDAYNRFINKIAEIYKKHFPLKTFTLGRNIRKPWITPALRSKINYKNSLYHSFVKTKDPNLLKKYKTYRNKLNKEIRTSRSRYLYSEFESCLYKSDQLWKKLNTFIRPRKSTPGIWKLSLDGREVSGNALANSFNDHFLEYSDCGVLNEFIDFMPAHNQRCAFLSPVTGSEVMSVFSSLKNSPSCDAEFMQIRPIKYVLDILCPYITYIFNICLSSALFPKRMQIAKVTVLFKKGDANDMGNYRPISVLPIFSKGLEKVIHIRMSSFLDKHNLISPAQFGFSKNKSTEMALLEQKEFILSHFEKQMLVLGIYVDFSKAFDCIHHCTLLKKLEIYGIRGHFLQLIQSYLSHRQQFVKIESYQSDLKSIIRGVPQGSILGPLLFNIYINDLTNICTKSKYILYADDASIFITAPDCYQLVSAANSLLIHLKNGQ